MLIKGENAMPSDDIVKKLYSKEDIRLELGLTPHKFNKWKLLLSFLKLI